MATNFPGPYECRFFYSVSIGGVYLTHSQRLNVRVDGTPTPGTPFADIDFLRRDDSPFAADAEVDAWVEAVKGMWNSGTPLSTWDYVELWKYEPESFDASFISTYPIGVAGTSASANLDSAQVIVTFRTQEGGIMKLNFLETIIASGNPDPLPFSNSTLDAVADALIAGTFPWLARDGSYPFAAIAAYAGQSEAVFKKRHRP